MAVDAGLTVWVVEPVDVALLLSPLYVALTVTEAPTGRSTVWHLAVVPPFVTTTLVQSGSAAPFAPKVTVPGGEAAAGWV